MVEFDVVVGKLHDFETADSLAEYFREYGIKACPQDARSCAISVFVGTETDKYGNVVTSCGMIELQETIVDEDTGHTYQEEVATVRHTHAMREFVFKFDSGKYPDLIADDFEYTPMDGDVDYLDGCECDECAERWYESQGYYG